MCLQPVRGGLQPPSRREALFAAGGLALGAVLTSAVYKSEHTPIKHGLHRLALLAAVTLLRPAMPRSVRSAAPAPSLLQHVSNARLGHGTRLQAA